MKKIQYPRYHVTDHPADFYVFYQEREGVRAKWSGWIKGDSSLWHKINKSSKEQKQKIIEDLATKPY